MPVTCGQPEPDRPTAEERWHEPARDEQGRPLVYHVDCDGFHAEDACPLVDAPQRVSWWARIWRRP
jgi:hypothetical protein